MAYLTEKIEKLKNQLKRLGSKKLAKRLVRDSSDSDSDSYQDNASGSTGNQVDKHLKLDKPTGIDLVVTDTRLIKATNLALDITKANEFVIKTPKLVK